MRRVVRGFWGPRVESAEALARRWKLTLDALAEILPVGTSRAVEAWRQIHSSGPATDLLPDEDSLLAALRAARDADGWSDRVGFGLRLVSEAGPGWKIEVSGNAGGASEFLLQSMVIGVGSPDTAEIPDADLLTAVAEAWDPDFGDVTDDDVLDALEDDAGFVVGEPSVGWIGYLSRGRAALLPEGMTAGRTELGTGGVLLVIAPYGHVDDVLRAHLLLRDAGVLQPLPCPMDRTAL